MVPSMCTRLQSANVDGEELRMRALGDRPVPASRSIGG